MTSTRIYKHRLFTAIVAFALAMLSAIDASAGQPPGFVYALNKRNGGINRVYGFRLDVISGAMTPLPGSPWTSAGQTGSPFTGSETTAYGNGRLFVANDGTDTLTVFNVNQVTGALTEETYSPIALGLGEWGCVAVHPSGSPVVVASASNSAALASFVVTSSSATAAAGSPFATGVAEPYSCAFSRDGNYVYTGGNSGNHIAGFAVAPATGVLTALPGSPFDSGNVFPIGYATDSAGRLFVANLAHAELRVFTTSGGVPTGVSGNPFPSGADSIGYRGILHPAGFYIGASPAVGVAVYQIAGSGSGTTLSPVSGSPLNAGGDYTTTLALSLDGSVLVTGHQTTRSLSSFRMNPTTGALTPLGIQNANTLGLTGEITGLALVPGPTPGDLDDDAKAEIAVFRPSTGQWFSLLSGTNYTTFNLSSWGNSTDTIVPADYDGDGRTDRAVYRPSNGTWYVSKSSGGAFPFGWFTVQFGTNTDLPVPGDYDGDGKADLGLFRPSTGEWFILTSTSNYLTAIVKVWGSSTDIPVQGDYTGDRKTDIAVFRPSTGVWWILKSNANFTSFEFYMWGTAGDVTAPGDYDGDGLTDLAVFRPSTAAWFVRTSNGGGYGSSFSVNWGLATDVAVAGDYDGDGHADIAVFRPSTSVWYVLTSRSNYTAAVTFTWGLSTDIPILRRP